ncbi:MAG: PHP domain-containing protein [Deltaproteobacteria bacterium]|nr:PHP domain-containing protein [Deltaproteobacteria bacterium]
MLIFSKNKVVSITRQGEDTLLARGILEDDIYGLEIEVALSLSSLEILSVEGKWNRAENRECPRAIPFLQEAVGYRITEGFSQKVRKTVGRKACRLFADILLECCHAAKEAVEVIQWEAEREAKPDIGLDEFLQEREGDGEVPAGGVTISPGAGPEQKERGPRLKEKVKAQGGVIIDLHVHTSPASPCSSAPVDDIIEEAKRIGLDGICLTDHNHVWPYEAVEDLRQRHGFLVLRGNEITTDQGDMLVFGLEKDIRGIITLEELRKEVIEAEGCIIAAHPFRGFLTFGVGKLGLSPEKAMERPLFKWVDGVEVLNSKVTQKENALASRVAEGLDLTAIGGSDSHEVMAVGIYATSFSAGIRDERELIEALKKGDGCIPLAYRQNG